MALLPDRLLSYSVAGTVVVPHFLGEHDHPWLRTLLEEHERFIGRPQRELDGRLRFASHPMHTILMGRIGPAASNPSDDMPLHSSIFITQPTVFC